MKDHQLDLPLQMTLMTLKSRKQYRNESEIKLCGVKSESGLMTCTRKKISIHCPIENTYKVEEGFRNMDLRGSQKLS